MSRSTRRAGWPRSLAGFLTAALLLVGPAAAQGGQVPQPAAAVQEPPPKQGTEPPLVLGLLVEGNERYTEAQIVAALGQRVGEPYDPVAIDQGVKRLWTSFRVTVFDVAVSEVPGGVELRVRLFELSSDRQPRFLGNLAIDTKTLKRWGLIQDQTELYVHQAARVRQRLLEGYRREGFHFAEVNVVTNAKEEGQGLADVIFEIREGPKVRVKGVEIEGNVSMPDTTFLLFFKDGLSRYSKRELKAPGLFNWRGSPFVEETLQADLLAMREVYRERGWLDAVVELRALEFTPERKGVRLRIVVDEGPRYTVASLAVRALQWQAPEVERDERVQPDELLFSEAELLAMLRLRPGEPLERVAIDRDRVTLGEHYGRHGYIGHPSLPKRLGWKFLDPEYVYDTEAHTAQVTYRIVQGRQLRLREVLISGTTHTLDRVLRREVSLFPGQQVDLGEIRKSLRRIQGTGYFTDASDPVNHREPTFRFVPTDEPQDVDVEFQVQEGRVIDFNIQGGVDSNDGAFGLVTLTMRNFDATDLPATPWGMFSEVYRREAFHGAGQRLDLEISPGTRVSRYRVRFYEPDIFRRHIQAISLDLDLVKRERRYRTHDEERLSKSIRFGKKLTYDTSIAMGYVHTDLEVDDLDDGGTPLSLREQEARGKEQLAGLILDLHTRSLDHLQAPTQGFRASWKNVLNSEALGSDYEFLQSQVNGHYYRPTGQRENGAKHILHLELGLGIAQPYGDTDEVPYTERFQLGGRSSLRGFEFRGVGPVDELSGDPLGGETMLTGTVEWWYPLYTTVQPGTYEHRETLRGTAFLDWGVLHPDSFDLDLSELRASIGFGIGLVFPIPLQLNFGFPVLSESVDRTRTFSFSLGIF